jgi:ribonuclease HI
MSELKTSKFTIYTDGGCTPNPGRGGWGAVIVSSTGEFTQLSGGEKHTTNNRMELQAAIEALKSLEEGSQVALHTDSQYVKNGITQWLDGWRERGWKTAAKKDVQNRDLWEALDWECDRHEIDWKWVKGHAGHKWNEMADGLATQAQLDAA